MKCPFCGYLEDKVVDSRESREGEAIRRRRECLRCERRFTSYERSQYGTNRLAEGKLPLCAEMCSTKSLLAGDGDIIAKIYKERVSKRGYGSGAWGWKTAYRETIAS